MPRFRNSSTPGEGSENLSAISSQCKELTELRREDETIRAIPVALAREPLRRVHHAFQGFFRRVKAGRKPGYPRFRSMDRYNSFSLPPGFRVEGERVLVHKLGGLRAPMDVPGERERYLKTATEST
jgi:putative transposase